MTTTRQSFLEPELCTPIDENCDGSPTLVPLIRSNGLSMQTETFGNLHLHCVVHRRSHDKSPRSIGYSENADDCDDLDGDLFPEKEICNGKLDDCNAAEDAMAMALLNILLGP